jgi:hypothetical protein
LLPLLTVTGMAALRIGCALTLAVGAAGCVASRPVVPLLESPPPIALPPAVLDPPEPGERSLEYPHGRWVLSGRGTVVSPYGWTWVPAEPAR